MVSYSDLQNIELRLQAAGSAVSTDESTIHILETQNSILTSKEFSDECKLITERAVIDMVRPNSSAGYVIGPDMRETIVYVDPSSRLRVIDFDEVGEEWLEREATSTIHYEVDPSGNVTACLDETSTGNIHVFFQKRKGILATFTLDKPLLTSEIHLHMPTGSPLWAGFIRGVVHIFYVSALDRCVHFAKRKSVDLGWIDKTWTRRPFNQTAKQIIVFPVLTGTGVKCEAYVLTQDTAQRGSLLYIAPGGEWSKLGKIDEEGRFISERSVDICCLEAHKNTLTEKRLGEILASDSSAIDALGGPLNITPLAAACWSGHLEAVTLLLDNPFKLANPNSPSPDVRSPLYYAVTQSLPIDRKEIVSALLDAGADVDACSTEDCGNTPLMIAVADMGDIEVVRELVRRGASLTKRNSRGQTAWMLANGADFEQELRPTEERESQVATSHSVQQEVIDVLVAITVLIVAYLNSDFIRCILQRVLRELKESGAMCLEEVEPDVSSCTCDDSSPVRYEAIGSTSVARSKTTSLAVALGVQSDEQGSTTSADEMFTRGPRISAKLPVAFVNAVSECRARVWWRRVRSWKPCIKKRQAQGSFAE